jgi:hypothetical protein
LLHRKKESSATAVAGQPSLLDPILQRQALAPETSPAVHAIGIEHVTGADIPKGGGTADKVSIGELGEGFLHQLRMRQKEHEVVRAKQLDDCIMPIPPFPARFAAKEEWQSKQ